ncbi:MAG: GntR family transcriptional regulator [Azospirillaceae bacterium]
MSGGSERRQLSQTMKAQLALRELVIRGELKPGERVSELQMVDRLGLSRSPLRIALVRLEEEGLLEAIPSGGFAVRTFSEREVKEAIEIRGTLEGLAVRLAAEHGVPRAKLAAAEKVVDAIDEVIGTGPGGFDMARYIALNRRFHDMLIALAGNASLERQLERVNALPFASPSAMVEVQAHLPASHHIFTIAQDQHRSVLQAIARREGARAEAIMREHARIALRNLEHALESQGSLSHVPGSALIRRRTGNAG